MAVDDYRGLEGYHRMIRELRVSIAREFPEKVQDLYVVDMAGDRNAEMAAAAAQFGMTVPQLMAYASRSSNEVRGEFPNIAGTAFAVPRPDGTTAWIVFHRPIEDIAQDPNAPTPHEILELSKATLHELGHATGVGTVAQPSGPAIDDAKADDIREESAAEVFAMAALTDNGISSEESDYLCAMYDARKYDPSHNGGFDRYNPSGAYRHLRDTYLPGRPQRPFTSYDQLTGLRDTYDATRAAFPQTPETRQQGLEYLAYQRALDFTAGRLRKEGLTEDQIAQWVIDRKSYIYDGAQVESGRTYLDHPTGDYRPAQPATGTYPQSVGRSWLAALDHPQDHSADLYAQWLVIGMNEMAGEGSYSAYGLQEGLELPPRINDPRWRPVAEMLARGEDPARVRDALCAVDVTEEGIQFIDGLKKNAQREGLRDVQGDGTIDNGDIRAWLQANGIPPDMANRFNYSDGVNNGELAMLHRASNNEYQQRNR